MERDFLRQVIDLKRFLNQEKQQLDLEKANAEEELLYAAPDKEHELQAKLLDIELKQLTTKSKLTRAQLFGMRYARGPDHHCIFCFVEHDVLAGMAEVQPKILGARLVKCFRCSKELIIND